MDFFLLAVYLPDYVILFQPIYESVTKLMIRSVKSV